MHNKYVLRYKKIVKALLSLGGLDGTGVKCHLYLYDQGPE